MTELDTDTETDSGTETGTGGDTAADASCVDTGVGTGTAGTCQAVTPGTDWQWDGECPGMITPCAMEVDGCALVLEYDGMSMGMPHEAVVYGAHVVFDDLGAVTGCRGTLEEPDTIVGCCGDGCTFRLTR